MSTETELHARSGSACELCGATNGLQVYEVPPVSDRVDACVLLCETCQAQLALSGESDANHWRCLNDSMWSPVPAVQVVAWRILNRFRSAGWPIDLLDRLYLDDDTLAWAQATEAGSKADESRKHVDCNGVVLQAGDTVTLTKDLNVKGAHFAAKRGTSVRGISLVYDNPEEIEGRVNGQQIVILTQFVKKSS
jgi:protein PhnA